MQTEKILVDKIVGGGVGLGRLENGMVVMLPYVLPGEEVLLKPLRRRKKHMEAELIEVIKPRIPTENMAMLINTSIKVNPDS